MPHFLLSLLGVDWLNHWMNVVAWQKFCVLFISDSKFRWPIGSAERRDIIMTHPPLLNNSALSSRLDKNYLFLLFWFKIFPFRKLIKKIKNSVTIREFRENTKGIEDLVISCVSCKLDLIQTNLHCAGKTSFRFTHST